MIFFNQGEKKGMYHQHRKITVNYTIWKQIHSNLSSPVYNQMHLSRVCFLVKTHVISNLCTDHFVSHQHWKAFRYYYLSFLKHFAIFIFYFLIVALLPLSNFLPLLSPAQPCLSHSHLQSPPSCPCPWVIYTCSLTRPFPFFPSLSPLVTVSLFLVSMPLVLCCSFVCFVHQVPLICESIWYFSFNDWFISLSLIFSSAIHAVVKGRSSFFLLCRIPLCKCTTVF